MIAMQVVYMIAMGASVYSFWRERYNRIFPQERRSEDSIVRVVIHGIYYQANMVPKLSIHITRLKTYSI